MTADQMLPKYNYANVPEAFRAAELWGDRVSAANVRTFDEFKQWAGTHVNPTVMESPRTCYLTLDRSLVSQNVYGQYGERMVEWSGRGGGKVLAHEYGHHIGDLSKLGGHRADALETAFFNRRTSGEVIRQLPGYEKESTGHGLVCLLKRRSR